MKKDNPDDIPPDGRYTFIAAKVGAMKGGEPAGHFAIESGPYAGRRVSSACPRGLRAGHRFEADLVAFWTDALTGEPVARDYRGGNIRVTYALDNFGRPASGNTYSAPADQRSRFIRT